VQREVLSGLVHLKSDIDDEDKDDESRDIRRAMRES